MGVRKNALADVVEVVGSAPDMSGDVTFCAWFMRRGDGSGWDSAIGIGDESGSWQNQVVLIEQVGAGNILRLYHRSTEVVSFATGLVDDRWYHLALYGDMSASGTIRATKYDSVLGVEETISGTGGTAAMTEDQVYFGEDPANEWGNARFAFGKIWERELTLNEIRMERWQGAPISQDALWGAWDMLDNTDTLDRSGNGNNLTLTGVDTEAHAPVAKFKNIFDFSAIFAATGTVYTQAVNGALSFAGGLVKQTNKNPTGVLTSSGAMLKDTFHENAGSLGFVGNVSKDTTRALTGALSFTGTTGALLAFVQSIAGSLGFSGTMLKQTNKNVGGTLTFVGGVQKFTFKFLAGTLDFAGNLLTSVAFAQAVDGVLSFLGNIGTLFIPGSGTPIRRMWRSAWGRVWKSPGAKDEDS